MLKIKFNVFKTGRKYFSLMLTFVLLLSTLLSPDLVRLVAAQTTDCANNLQNVATPLIDLGTDTYTRDGISKQGGLYDGGTNVRPQSHLETILNQTAQITPLNAAGEPDPDGKIVVVSLGMSNAAQEFGKFFQLVHPDDGVAEGLNQNLQIVNGAKGGQVARNWVSTDFYDSTWGWIDQQLAANDVTANQVEVLWMKHAEGGFSREFGDRNEDLKANLRTIIALAADGRYPNLKVIYLSSRTRGHVDQFNPGEYGTLSPEPTAYEYGFAMKEIVAEYMETSMALPVPVAVTWGPYLWIDGENERSDGLTWPPSMLVEDCTHPSPIPGGGQDTVASMLMNFFTTDETASSWFLEGSAPPATATVTPTATATQVSNPRATSTPLPTATSTVNPSATATPSTTAVPPTATATTMPGPGNNVVFNEDADAALLSNRPTTNLGLSEQLSTDASPEILSLLRFNVQNISGSVNNATLRLFAESDSAVGVDVSEVAADSWVETAVTYNTAPAIGSTITSSGEFDSGTWVEIDITSYITSPGEYSLAISSSDGNRLTFSSGEGSNPPELEVTVNVGSSPTPSSTPIQPNATATATKPPTSAPTTTPLPTNTSIPTAAATATATASASSTPQPNNGAVHYLSLAEDGSVAGINYADEDVLAFDTNSSTWSIVIDGSDLGLALNDVDALHRLPDGSFLLSLERGQSIGSLGTVDDAEMIRFIPSSLGDTTAGTFEKYFDGTDVGLAAGGEDINGFGIAPDGRPVVTTLSNFSDNVSGEGKDLIVLNDPILGDPTSGTWATYFDGSNAELSGTNEDIDSLWLDANGNIYLSTSDSFTVTGASGSGASILLCTPVTIGDNTSCTYTLFWDGTGNGLTGANIDGLTIEP